MQKAKSVEKPFKTARGVALSFREKNEFRVRNTLHCGNAWS